MDVIFILYNIYINGDTLQKRDVIGSIFPEKFSFENFKVRTARLNEAVRLVYTLDVGFSENENGTSAKKSDLSRYVGLPVRCSENFVLDLKRLSRIDTI